MINRSLHSISYLMPQFFVHLFSREHGKFKNEVAAIASSNAVMSGTPSHFSSKGSRSHLFCMLLTPTYQTLGRPLNLAVLTFINYYTERNFCCLSSSRPIGFSLYRELYRDLCKIRK